MKRELNSIFFACSKSQDYFIINKTSTSFQIDFVLSSLIWVNDIVLLTSVFEVQLWTKGKSNQLNIIKHNLHSHNQRFDSKMVNDTENLKNSFSPQLLPHELAINISHLLRRPILLIA